MTLAVLPLENVLSIAWSLIKLLPGKVKRSRQRSVPAAQEKNEGDYFKTIWLLTFIFFVRASAFLTATPFNAA